MNLPTPKTLLDPQVLIPLGMLLLLLQLELSTMLPNGMFEDPGIGWHLKSGELILEQGKKLNTGPLVGHF